MTDLAVLAEPGALDQYADPGAYIVLSCERAKAWLTECIEHGDIDQLVDLKVQADAIRIYTTAKQLGKDVTMAAEEIIRRAERGIGLAIRKGQASGSILSANGRPETADNVSSSVTDASGIGRDVLSRRIYPLADGITDEQFDEVIAEAKVEGDLSGANVVRTAARKKVLDESKAERPIIARQMASEGHTTEQIASYLGVTRQSAREFLGRHGIDVPADAIVGKKSKLDSNRIVRATVEQVAGINAYLDSIDYSALDQSQFDYWVSSLSDAIRSLTTLRNNLKKEQTQ